MFKLTTLLLKFPVAKICGKRKQSVRGNWGARSIETKYGRKNANHRGRKPTSWKWREVKGRTKYEEKKEREKEEGLIITPWYMEGKHS